MDGARREAGTTLLGNYCVLIQRRDHGGLEEDHEVEMEGKVLNLECILELQLMELSDGCEVKRNKGGFWFDLNNCWMLGLFTEKK